MRIIAFEISNLTFSAVSKNAIAENVYGGEYVYQPSRYHVKKS